MQIKGQSDTLPALSPNDEYASFEVFDRLLGPAALKGTARQLFARCVRPRSGHSGPDEARSPFKYGIVGGADIHNALSTSDENTSAGGQFGIDPATMLPQGEKAKRALGIEVQTVSTDGKPVSGPPPRRTDILERSSAGLTGVWAEESNRASIFAALKRKETFATSGPRMRVRMFGGWDFARDMTRNQQWVAQAYARGVPMGGDLPAKPSRAKAPFHRAGVQGCDGRELDRVQIIKVWLEGGRLPGADLRRRGVARQACGLDDDGVAGTQFDPSKPAVVLRAYVAGSDAAMEHAARPEKRTARSH